MYRSKSSTKRFSDDQSHLEKMTIRVGGMNPSEEYQVNKAVQQYEHMYGKEFYKFLSYDE